MSTQTDIDALIAAAQEFADSLDVELTEFGNARIHIRRLADALEQTTAGLREAEACIEAVEDELDRLEKACVAVPSKKFFRATIATYKPTTENGSER